MILKTFEWDEKCINVSTNQLIALCEVFEDFKSFYDDLESLIKSKNNRDLVSLAYKIMKGDFSLYSRKYKSFIQKHENTIKIMKKYSCLYDLTCLSYDAKGNRYKNLSIDYIYEYILENKKSIEIIKENATKLKRLGFLEFKYGKDLDFKNYEYDLTLSYGSNFAFLENIYVIPTYLNDPIKYKTNSSNYCMCLSIDDFNYKKTLSKYNKKMYLNNLIFDSNLLLNEITIESTVDVIKKLSLDKSQEYSDIQKTVDFGMATMDLDCQFEQLKSVINKIDEIKTKEELVKILSQMEVLIRNLYKIEQNFEKEVIDSSSFVTSEIIDNEQKNYINRRNWSYIDIC
ncbi:MAG: hypothetical protein E7170_02735 [Firmicutes bacterium]|nr:hypothetical protein [Bacillota bacterium]